MCRWSLIELYRFHHCSFGENGIFKTIWNYRRLSLSQSPGDQTKYFEISVVWDSQSVTSFTICMYVALQLARKQSRTVELRNVANSTLFIHSKNVCDQCLFDPVLHAISSSICDTHLSAWQFLQHVGNVCCLHQRMPIRRVQSLKLQRCPYVPVGFNRAHLIVLTISVITAVN